MTMKSINLGLVSEHVLFRKLLVKFLEEHDIKLMVYAENISDLLTQLKTTTVSVLLFDAGEQSHQNRESLQAIRNIAPQMRILAVLPNCEVKNIVNLIDAGIYSCISKDDEPEELLKAITSVYENRLYCNQLFTEALYFYKENLHMNASKELLDEREKLILKYLWAEKSNKEIADKLYLSVRSIEKIRQDLKEKVGVRSIIGLLKYALDHKILNAEIK